ncbi:D-(-)-3-hydroxybutyrate oligomer hydrolase [Ralstonia insidiosa]|uniref:D-(-)-3-hydroxybutyrate oligomer hydrolase n=1 Tax=Ralstonia insidiosa TaxID=190721 RepID=A0AAC9BH56_9RALS|nr:MULTISPECIES: 3-hydroxybutyrate oligomer hydrolase family protein [Ralstonia]ANH73766.1 D-(-)-3-hydroxybutyrate oligomer hydrolase [Ralstonia insidiosa]MBY4704450.1 D-(-)-3-hydroxybutyrate oligomer hydrolase [Ralstonia insidiosa]GAQ30655.1 putative D--3-hydroxybutyrate oligomer hydrolase lipoprotein transmembrane [Ralstonia sp. NT80]
MKSTRITRLRRHVSVTHLAAAGAMLLAGCSVLSACGGGNDGNNVPGNVKPAFVGKVTTTHYDGSTDDLLTAGLGASGLASATAPTIANPTAPTAAELRRLAIYANYRALVDTAAKGGYGTLYGPNVDASGNVTSGSGMVAGSEYVAYSDDGTGQQNVVLLVQIPDSFDVNNPCIITATSSGSRGIYGAISTGEWGLKRKCAVAYTDKGTGAGPHDLATDTVALQDGTRTTRAAAGANAQFAAPLTSSQLAAFNAATPNRLAFKHAHSQRNPEKDWGRFTLQAVQFAFWAINDKVAPASGNLVGSTLPVRPNNTIVIASSISNGGGAAIAAAEQDTGGWIDGVAVGEPGLNLPASPSVQVVRGGVPLQVSGKPLFDYVSYANVYRLCAASSASVSSAPAQGFFTSLPTFPANVQANRCAALKAAGLLNSSTAAAQADEALQKMRAYGWEPESDLVHASMSFYEIDPSVATTFGNALSRSSVADNLCGMSFSATDASFHPTAVSATALAQMAALGNGIPPTSGVQLVNNNAQGGPTRSNQSVDSTGTQAANLDAARCLRNLLTGGDATSQALQTGISQTLRTGNLQGKPTLIVQGRNDALLPVNHGSRPYLGLNALVEGGSSKLSYIEVMNAQHFDGFIDLVPGYDALFVPLVLYEQRALDAMYAFLKSGTPLPPSQVVRTTPRGGTAGSAPAISAANVPNFTNTPAAGDRISVTTTGGVATVSVPN